MAKRYKDSNAIWGYDLANEPLEAAKVLVLGLAYKKNVSDIRESPALTLLEILKEKGAAADYHDPYVEEIPMTRELAEFAGRRSAALTAASLAGYDAVLIATDHDNVDYGLVAANARLIIDTRNVMARTGLTNARVVKA